MGSLRDPVTTEAKAEVVFTSVLVYTLGITIRRCLFILMDIESYLSGYADGEGCFCVSFNRSSRHRLGWEIRPSFSVSQNGDRAEVLYLFQKHFGCGTIRPDRSDSTLKYEIRNLNDLLRTVIPHFTKYPLLSGKKNDFESFKSICFLLNGQKHRERNGFDHIVNLAFSMNTSGIRKHAKEEIRYSLRP